METHDALPDRIPKRPESLPELAERILVALGGRPLASNIVLGGGIALKHYVDFRPTQDIDAWWRTDRDPEAFADFEQVLREVAAAHGLGLIARRFGTTDSLEFVDTNRRKVFSFQIAARDVKLSAPLISAWPPVLVETLAENLGSKMNALVNRGAPRDFMDIHRIVTDGLATTDACWDLWLKKNPGSVLIEGAPQVLGHLDRLEQRRPIETVPPQERDAAEQLRRWFRDVFLRRHTEFGEDRPDA